jgi:hypothetical protein
MQIQRRGAIGSADGVRNRTVDSAMILEGDSITPSYPTSRPAGPPPPN